MADTMSRTETRRGNDGRTMNEPNATGIIETVKEQVSNVAEGAAGMAGKAVDTASEWASAASDAAARAKDKARDMAGAAAHRAGELPGDMVTCMRQHPIETAVLAGIIGFAAGMLLSPSLRGGRNGA